jgi:hypothetical protein
VVQGQEAGLGGARTVSVGRGVLYGVLKVDEWNRRILRRHFLIAVTGSHDSVWLWRWSLHVPKRKQGTDMHGCSKTEADARAEAEKATAKAPDRQAARSALKKTRASPFRLCARTIRACRTQVRFRKPGGPPSGLFFLAPGCAPFFQKGIKLADFTRFGRRMNLPSSYSD